MPRVLLSSINDWWSFLVVVYKYSTFICTNYLKENQKLDWTITLDISTSESCWSVTEAWAHCSRSKYYYLSLYKVHYTHKTHTLFMQSVELSLYSCQWVIVSVSFFQRSVFPSLTELLAAPALAVDVEVEGAVSLGWKAKEAELMQKRFPVGLGPSSKRCPRWAPHWLQVVSTLCIP